jgi:hypothetical protein
MHHRWAALLLVLALCAVQPAVAAGQGLRGQSQGRKVGTLGQNYPNPVTTATYIPFAVDDCDEEAARVQHVVSLRVYNVLAQLVAVPVLQGPGEALTNAKLACGQYVAYWDGRLKGSGKPAAPGVYVYELVVDGQRTARKMIVGK